MPTPAKMPDARPRTATDPASPFFARVAAGYLEEGRTREALALCVEGTKIFPRYATGSLILGRCYEALGRNAEAAVEYRRVLEAFPDIPAVKHLVERTAKSEADAYQRFVETLEPALLSKKNTLTFAEFATGIPPSQTNTVEYLIKQLRQAPKGPRGASMPMIPVVQEDLTANEEPSPGIVTETLAEIYAGQGRFQEAIQAYKTLTELKPEESQRFTERITQLEEMIRLEGENRAQ